MLPFSTVTIQQLQILIDRSYSTARRQYQQICDALAVEVLQWRQLAVYWGCTIEDLRLAMLPVPKK